MKKRGKSGISPVCDSLELLMKHHCPEGFYPWQVHVGKEISVFCFARTKIDAIKKVMNYCAVAHPCSIDDIIKSSKGM